MKFKAEISEKEIPFLDTTVFKGERFYEDAILDIRTLFLTDISIHGFHFLSRSQPRSQGSLLPALLVNPDPLRRAGSYEGISMTKFNEVKVKRVKSNPKYTELKLVKNDHGKRKKY